MQHQTKTLHPTKIGVVTITVILNPGIDEVHTSCNLSAAIPTEKTNIQISYSHILVSSKSTLLLAAPAETMIVLVIFIARVIEKR